MSKDQERKCVASSALSPPKPPDSFTGWVRDRVWKRWGTKGLFAIWGATVLAGAGAFVYQNWEKPLVQDVRQYFRSPRQLDEKQDAISLERADELGFSHSYGLQDSSEYSLLLQVTAKFSDEKYNDPATLSSASELSLFAIASNGGEPKIEGQTVLLTRADSDYRKLQWIAEILLDKKPTADIPLVFTLGSWSERILIGKRKWQEHKYKYGETSRGWYRAQAKIDLNLPPPEWPVVQSVRLLNTTDPLVSIIETTVQNYSSRPLALDQIALHGNHPKNNNFACAEGDRPQKVTLNWERISDNKTVAATTELHGVNIKVPVEYLDNGICENYDFTALIPINEIVPPHGLTRVQLLIKDMPKMRGGVDRRSEISNRLSPDFPTTPRGLTDWFRLEITVNPSERSQAVFPHKIKVFRE